MGASKVYLLFLSYLIFMCGESQESSPVCLGQLARLQMMASIIAAETRYCSPGEFVEIEFTLRFGCDVPTHIDQGVRFDVEPPGGAWEPIRFYTPTLTPAPPQEGEEPRVMLEEGGRSVYAVAGSIRSSLPLLFLNSSSVGVAEGAVIREYLCQDYVDKIKSGERFRLRWLQRYLTNPQADVATWSLDNFRIRVWNGTCFLSLLSEDFESAEITPQTGVRISTRRGSIVQPPCLNDSVAYLNGGFPANADTRRFVLVNLLGHSLSSSCVSPENIAAERSAEVNCSESIANSGLPEPLPIPNNATITCSRGNVSCRCESSRVMNNNLMCATTEVVTTTEATPTTTGSVTPTQAPMTTETPPTTMQATTASTERVLLMIRTGMSILEFSDGELLQLVNQYSGGSAPFGVSKIVLDAANIAFQDISKGDENVSESGRVLSFLDDFALRAYNSSNGPIETDSYTMNVTNVEVDDMMMSGRGEEQEVEPLFTALDQDEGSIALPNELFTELESMAENFQVASFLFNDLSNAVPLETENETNVVIISSVVSASIGGCGLMPCPTGNLSLSTPIRIHLRHTKDTQNGEIKCFFLDVDRGVWSTDGCERVDAESNSTFSVCECQHLTHFAILVSPTAATFIELDSLSLSIISYIGLGISLVCLLLTVIFFLSFGKKLFTKGVHNFIHLNLAIALFLGYLVFSLGVELAAWNEALCQAVTAVLHYLFLAVFCWMLSEGVMLYLMLVVVFTKLAKKWWFFLLLGWLLPLPFVAIGLATVRDEYGVRVNGTLAYCWLSSGEGQHAIWTFVAPMLAIIVINAVLLTLVLISLFKSRRRKNEIKRGKKSNLLMGTVKSAIILLPLLGLTWVFGLLAVNRNTLVFAWIFTILNTLQGLFIFVLHVLRHEKVWTRLQRLMGIQPSKRNRSSRSHYGFSNFTASFQRSKSKPGSRNNSLPTATSIPTSPRAFNCDDDKFEKDKLKLELEDCNGALAGNFTLPELPNGKLKSEMRDFDNGTFMKDEQMDAFTVLPKTEFDNGRIKFELEEITGLAMTKSSPEPARNDKEEKRQF